MSRSMIATGAWQVVVNPEGRQSVWPASHALPAGWQSLALAQDRDAALAQIAAHWHDPRPKSLQQAMVASHE